MSNELTPQQTFQQKLEERIRKDIGELMPDEALSKIVASAIEKAFFEERVIEGRYFSDRQIEVPWIVKIMRELLDARVNEAVKKWMFENDEKVRDMIAERFDVGIAKASISAIDSLFREEFDELRYKFEGKIAELQQ